MAIATFTDSYVRRYRDNGQIVAYVEWTDDKGRWGRTEAHPAFWWPRGRLMDVRFGTHMHALMAAAKRQGVPMRRETW